MKRIAILGSTGSIGRQCLDVVESLPERFGVAALAAGENVEQLARQVGRHRPEIVSVADAGRVDELAKQLRAQGISPLPEIQSGRAGLRSVATLPSTDLVVSAAVGVVGLEATYAAVRQGKQVALSNKEVLVAAGELVMAAARASGVELLPVDSEHNAIHQCLRAGRHGEVRRLVLTASGGPFRRTPLARLSQVTPEQALAHPNWRMGRRITIDSATLINKGFEVIEAYWLFGMKLEQIEVVIHPQSTVHSMVEFMDRSILAQLGPTDMRLPIQYALTYPERLASNGCQLEWATLRRLDFEKVPTRKFPCLGLAREALRLGGSLPCALNAADEVAVTAFLERRLPFLGIPRVIERVLERMPRNTLRGIEDVLAADGQARQWACEEIENQKA
ncbi:MAG TPA: 1-deoxy-D-xylulose-5-phosphate reductoisomerase [Candidatus Acidoferrales bacterium]|nr:1-deoxy-D-xylulose-5-phosphate reductoisomerase [Candidatus Acidoferrales bacterium]